LIWGRRTRGVLDLVDDNRRFEALEEELGIIDGEPPLEGIVEGDVVTSLLGDVLEEGRLSHLARSRDEKDREGLRDTNNDWLDGARNIHFRDLS